MAIDLGRLVEIVAEQLQIDAEQVIPEASFMDDLGADSLDTVELIMAPVSYTHLTLPTKA